MKTAKSLPQHDSEWQHPWLRLLCGKESNPEEVQEKQWQGIHTGGCQDHCTQCKTVYQSEGTLHMKIVVLKKGLGRHWYMYEVD